jgi:uncharacterized membrane protein
MVASKQCAATVLGINSCARLLGARPRYREFYFARMPAIPKKSNRVVFNIKILVITDCFCQLFHISSTIVLSKLRLICPPMLVLVKLP